MAIQKVDVTVPGGDTPRSANIKINANFSNTEHAASRMVGVGTNQIPLANQVLKAANSYVDGVGSSNSGLVRDFEAGTRYTWVRNSDYADAPPSPAGVDRWTIATIANHHSAASYCFQVAHPYTTEGVIYTRIVTPEGQTKWAPVGQTSLTYTTTTASGANVVVDSTGQLMRSTSSERYKDVLSSLEIDEEVYEQAMALKPIIYRSTADADDPKHHYFSFSAEQLGALDKAFALWRYTEKVIDDEGNTTEQPLVEPQAEGLNINAILAFGHAISIKQDEKIKALEARLDALDAK